MVKHALRCNDPRTAVLFHHWGPYHLMRLQESAETLSIVGIEAYARSSRYDWEPVAAAEPSVERIMLVPVHNLREIPKTHICRRIIACLDRCSPTCVAIPGWSGVHALAALSWCMTRRVPAVCMGDSTSWDWRRKSWKEWSKRCIMNSFATALAAGTASKEYFQQLGMPEDRIFLGYNAVDNAYFRRSVERFRMAETETREELKVHRPFFLVVARFIPEKNLVRMVEAYAVYRSKMYEYGTSKNAGRELWDLVILGGGPLRERLQTHIRSVGLPCEALSDEDTGPSVQRGEAVVHLRGFAQYDELPKYYALAECLILPSQKDTWGLVVNEAMASGLPVIVSRRCGCAQDLVRDRENGYLIDPFDVEDIAAKMLHMASLPDSERQAMGRRSQEIIAEWGPERFACGLKAAVEKALEIGPIKSSLADRLLLKALTLRS